MRGWPSLALALVGCGAPAAPPSSGGTDVAAGLCGRGLAVVSSDYQSTSVALVDWEGGVLSPRFLTSGSAEAGLSAPLSGDVVLPAEAQDGESLLIVDRAAGVITEVAVVDGAVHQQIGVRTGFASNPQDAVEVEGRHFVSRLDPNASPGSEPFDGGSDVVVVEGGTIVDRVELAVAVDDDAHLPRPNRMVRTGDGRVRVLLSGYDATFQSAADSRVVTLDASGAVRDVHLLVGMRGCSALAEVHDGLVVACTGEYDGGATPDLATSGLVWLVADGDRLEERRRWAAGELGDRPVGFSVARRGGWLFAVTLGNFLGATPVRDHLLAIPVEGGEPRVLLESENDAFALGEVRCPSDPSCGPCWLTDAERGLVPITIDEGPATGEPLRIDDDLGLPPRSLGAF